MVECRCCRCGWVSPYARHDHQTQCDKKCHRPLGFSIALWTIPKDQMLHVTLSPCIVLPTAQTGLAARLAGSSMHVPWQPGAPSSMASEVPPVISKSIGSEIEANSGPLMCGFGNGLTGADDAVKDNQGVGRKEVNRSQHRGQGVVQMHRQGDEQDVVDPGLAA